MPANLNGSTSGSPDILHLEVTQASTAQSVSFNQTIKSDNLIEVCRLQIMLKHVAAMVIGWSLFAICDTFTCWPCYAERGFEQGFNLFNDSYLYL